MLLTRFKMRKISFNIDDCLVCHHEKGIIDYFLKHCDLTKSVWLNTDLHCPNPNKPDLSLIDWLAYLKN